MLPLLALLAVSAAADDSLLKSRPKNALVDEIVELKPKDGDHFNLEAPQKCGGAAPLELLAHRLRCQLTRPGRNEILVTLCDDALTFCRQERFDVDVRGAASAAAASPLAAKPKGGRRAPEGFIDNDPAAAAALAKKEGKPVLIDFYGIWCPPCNDLEEHAYPDPAFRKAAEGWLKLGLDADAETSFALKARYKVGGYPTLIAVDPSMKELGRVVGYRSGPALAQFLDDMRARIGEPVETAARLVARGGADATPARRLRVAQWRADRGEFSAAEHLLEGTSEPAARRALLEARRERARREENSTAALQALRGLIREFPGDPEYADWVESLSETDKEAARGLKSSLHASVERWTADPALGASGEDPGDLLVDEAAVLDTLGDKDAAKAEYSRAADAYGAQAARSPLKMPRAANFGRADALLKAGRRDEAKALYESLVKAYPSEFTFNYEYASALADDGDAAAAYPYAAAAAGAAYGDNWLRAVRLKAELELKLGRAADAAATVDAALAATAPPKSAAVRTFRYVAALRALQSRIAAARAKS
jgi:thioredoxin-like negative regulator of GroEL